MGDRIGIQFVDEDGDESVVLHSHWMGRALLVLAQQWLQSFGEGSDRPSKMYCNEAAAHFLMWVGATEGIVDIDIQDQDDYGDTEDNGVFIVNLVDKVVA